MNTKTIAPYGTWISPIDATTIGRAEGSSELRADGDTLYFLEQRAAEGGRGALRGWSRDRGAFDAGPRDGDVATRVQEMGGGAYAAREGILIGSYRDDRVWVFENEALRELCAVAGTRFADFWLVPGTRMALAVREDHRNRQPNEPLTTIVRLDLDTKVPSRDYAGDIVRGGADFYAQPRIDHAGERLAWIEWNLPDMPWDATRLCIAPIDTNLRLGDLETVAGDDARESISHLAWGADGTLYFTSDRSGWWNPYAYREHATRRIAELALEIGAPLWVFGTRALEPLADGRIACSFVRDGTWCAGILERGTLRELPVAGAGGALAPVPFGGGYAAIAAGLAEPPKIVLASDFSADATFETIVEPGTPKLAPGNISLPRSLAIPTPDDDTVFAFFYPPRNAHFEGPLEARPPLVMMAHGGPTALYSAKLDRRVQFWTTRGFAVAHVNYRGSTGFGTAYRRKLIERWCDLDVIDAGAVANYLAASGLIDPAHIAIRGGSASGAWALLAIAGSTAFSCATSEFGVTDLELLAGETHKFESRYTDSLIGPLPQTLERYRERSPINRTATMRAPVLLLQGLDDKIVPPNQAELMREALRAAGVEVEYRAYAGEGHGFRKRETIVDAIERELAFYRRVFGIV